MKLACCDFCLSEGNLRLAKYKIGKKSSTTINCCQKHSAKAEAFYKENAPTVDNQFKLHEAVISLINGNNSTVNKLLKED